MEESKPTRVAIVGSGMAGLVTAYLLQRDGRYDVTIFESGNTLSLDAASISTNNAAQGPSRIDLPMRAFAGGYYNNLKRMYDYLGVAYRSQAFLFEFARESPPAADNQEDGTDSTYFVHASNLHQLFPPRPSGMSTIAYWKEVPCLIVCYLWFSICCFLVAPYSSTSGSESLEEYLRRIWLPKYFISFYLLPLISSVTTCPHQTLLGFPASDVINYKRQTHAMPHYTVSNGVKTVQNTLVHGINYELSAAVLAVWSNVNGVTIRWRKMGPGQDTLHEDVYDRVVLAVAPDVVGKIYEPLSRHMNRIPTTPVESLVQKYDSTNPKIKTADRHNSQLIRLRTSITGISRTESRHVQPCGATVITCPFTPIDSSLLLHSAKFTRVLRTPESRRVVNAIFKETHQVSVSEKALPVWRNGDDNVWLAGGWCWDGMVLLEGCVVSAMRVADAFGVEIPWRASARK